MKLMGGRRVRPAARCGSIPKLAAQIDEQAARWVVKLDRPASADELRQLDEWLDASPRHQAAFVRMRLAWHRANRLRRLDAC